MRDGPRGFGQDSSCPGLLRCLLAFCQRFAYGAFTLCGAPFQALLLRSPSRFGGGPTTPARALTRPVWAAPLSIASTRGITFVFSSSGYLDVSVPLVGSCLRAGGGVASAGLPHSDIRGSRGICPSPRLFAACRVLLRLREPRHPSCALSSFLFFLREERLVPRFFYNEFTLYELLVA